MHHQGKVGTADTSERPQGVCDIAAVAVVDANAGRSYARIVADVQRRQGVSLGPFSLVSGDPLVQEKDGRPADRHFYTGD